MNLKVRLSIMNFLEFAVWGAYLTCMGRYLSNLGFGDNIGWFYSVQGFVSIFMPALIGIIADRWVQAQKMLGICHLLAGLFMMAAAWYGYSNGAETQFGPLFTRNGHRQGFPAYSRLWYRRLYPDDAFRRYYGLPG